MSDWRLDGISATPGVPYTFAVTLGSDGGQKIATLAAADLLSFDQFRRAILEQTGVMFRDSGSDWTAKITAFLPTARDGGGS